MHTLRVLVGLGLGIVVLAGCNDQYAGRLAVSGAVTLKGQPLAEGSIMFAPLDGQDTSSGGPISAGKYSVPRQQGLKPGKYLVRISAGDGKTVANEDEAGGPGGTTNIISVDRIPAEWNVKSNKEIEVKSGEKNAFNFDIPEEYIPKSKKK